ncbi:MAG: 30S ribosomal protein S6 [PVC group bacterium]
MNPYEMVNIIDAQWGDGDFSRAREMISGEIVKAGGEVLNIGSMGRRKLAYPIEGRSEGLYVISHFTHPPEGMIGLRDSLRLNPAVVRTIIVRSKSRAAIELAGEAYKEGMPAPGPVYESAPPYPGEEGGEDDVAFAESEFAE